MTTVYRCLAGAALAAVVFAGSAMLAANWFTPAAADESLAKADADTPSDNKCVADTTHFKAEDKRAYFIVALENKCEQRVKCVIHANIRTARGNTKGHGTLVLAPRSAGAEAKKSYSLRVKVAGGMAQVARDCQAF